jgi:hypothetical protein
MAGQLTIDTLKTSTGVLATQNGMTGIARAWTQFNSSGTIAGSFNVSSITVNASNDFTLNFTTAMPNANYSIVGTAGGGVANGDPRTIGPSNANPTTTACRVTVTYSVTPSAVAYNSIAIFSS